MGLDSNVLHTASQSSGQEPRRLRKGVFTKIVLALVIVTVLGYTAAVLLIACTGGVVPDSLTYSFFGFFGTEIVSLVTIRCRKMKGDGKNAAFGEPAGGVGEDSGAEVLRGAEEVGAEADSSVPEG
mgnify:CR=1 FL=1